MQHEAFEVVLAEFDAHIIQLVPVLGTTDTTICWEVLYREALSTKTYGAETVEEALVETGNSCQWSTPVYRCLCAANLGT